MSIKLNPNIWIPFYDKENNYFMKIYQESMISTNCTRHDNFKKQIRFFSLFQCVKLSLKMNKDFNFAECGCFKGHSSYGISKILSDNEFKHEFHIFDSFEGGLSEFEDYDKTMLNSNISMEKQFIRRNNFSSSYEEVKKNLENFDFIKIYESWIPDKFDEIKNLKFQFVHIDVDLYNPTYESLKFFYPRLVPGGIIVCDDYNFADFPGAKSAWDNYFNEISESEQPNLTYEVPLGSIFLIK
jgi:hypothetical protein